MKKAEYNLRSEQRTSTMTEIAGRLGVSKSTVSRALRGDPRVSEKTRIRVQQAVLESSNPEPLRKAKAGQQAAIIVPSEKGLNSRLSNPFYGELITSVIERLTDVGLGSFLVQLPLWSQTSIEGFLNQYKPDACIVLGQSSDNIGDDKLGIIRAQCPAMVCWGAAFERSDYCVVGSDNWQAAALATEHLIKQNRKNILFLGDTRYLEGQLRFKGFEQAHKANKLDLHSDCIIRVPPFDLYQACIQLTKAIKSSIVFDGIFAVSDLLAMHAINTLRDHNIEVPEDVAVVGFDDIGSCQYFYPQLTTVKQNIATGVELLVANVSALMDGKQANSEMLSSELVIRHSCGAINKN